MHLRTLGTAALLLLGATACDGFTEPEPDLTVSLATTATTQISQAADGSARVTCDIALTATATGHKGSGGRWSRGMIRYYAGRDTAALDSLPLTAFEMGQIFGGESLQPGYSGSNTLRFQGSVPFSVRMELAYQVTGRQRETVASTTAVCGPRPGEGPAPTLSNVSVMGPAGAWQPGDTITVAFTAHAPLGLWETGVQVAGAFEHLSRQAHLGATAPVTRSVQVVVPSSAVLGSPVQVRAFAVDAALQPALGATHTSAPLVDRTAPVVQVIRTTTLGTEGSTSLVGQYGDRDTVDLHTVARDNHQLAYAVYEMAGRRDSVALPPGPGFGDRLRIPLRAGTAGELGFRVHLRDVAGNRSPEAAAQPGAMRAYPVRDVNVRSGQVPDRVEDVVVDPTRNLVYSLVVNHNAVFVHRLPDMALERTVPLTFSATSLELTADGDSLLISSRYHHGILVMPVNAAAAPPVRLLQGVFAVNGIRIAHTGRAIALATMAGGAVSVLEVDLGAGTQRVIRTGLQVPDAWEGVTRSRDRRRMLLGAGCTFDVQTEQVGTCRLMRSGGLAGSVHGDETGERWGRLDAVYGPDLRPVLPIGEPVAQLLAGIVPVGDGAYVSSRRGLVRFGPDGLIRERLAAPALGHVRLSDDGTRMASWDFGAFAEGGYRIRVLELR
jgi:hypothetical protein